MQVPIRIGFHAIEPSDFITQRIHQRAARLERLCGRIVACEVAVEATQHRHHGDLYRVRIALRVPGSTLMVSRNAGQNRARGGVYVAIRDAFDAAERRLEDWLHRPRAMMAGKPIRIDEQMRGAPPSH